MPSFENSEAEKSIREAVHAYDKRHREDDGSNSSEIIAAINSFAESYNAQRNESERKRRTKIFIDLSLIILLFGTCLFTGAALWVLVGELHEKEMTYARIKESAQAANASAEAAKASAEAAKTAVELSDMTAETRLRAYVDISDIGISVITVPGGNDAQLVGVLVIKNFGATPSNNIEVSARTIFGKYPLGSSSLPGRSKNSIVTARFAPGQERKVNVPMEESGITIEQRAAWEKETIAAYFYGRVKYDDVFNRACTIYFKVLKSKSDGDTSRFASDGNNVECSKPPPPAKPL